MDLLCLDFLNSDLRDYLGSGRREDRLRDPVWLERFLERWGFEPLGKAGSREIQELVALRTAMWRAAEALVAGSALDTGDVDTIAGALGATEYRRRLTHDGHFRVDEEPVRKSWGWVRSEIASSFCNLLANRDPQRLKICENADCHWVFFDESKNRTRRWCGEVCGNLIKVRRFRRTRR